MGTWWNEKSWIVMSGYSCSKVHKYWVLLRGDETVREYVSILMGYLDYKHVHLLFIISFFIYLFLWNISPCKWSVDACILCICCFVIKMYLVLILACMDVTEKTQIKSIFWGIACLLVCLFAFCCFTSLTFWKVCFINMLPILVYMARASIKRAMTHRQFKWLSFCSINSYAHINTSKAVNN